MAAIGNMIHTITAKLQKKCGRVKACKIKGSSHYNDLNTNTQLLNIIALIS